MIDAPMVVALTGLVIGLLTWWQSRKRDNAAASTATSAATSTARDVASRAADAAVGALNAALDRQQGEIEELHADIEELRQANAQLREDNTTLLTEVRLCHDDKARLEERVRQLEQATR